MKRTIISLALAAGLAAGFAPAVHAAPQSVDGFTLEWSCPNIKGKIELVLTGSMDVRDLPGGRQIISSPNLNVTVIAPDGTTLEYVITGANHIEVLENGNILVKATGRNLLLVPRTKDHPSGLFLTSGNVSFVLDEKGREVETFSGSGSVTDVCEALAA